MHKILVALLGLFFLSASIGARFQQQQQRPLQVSVIQLVANPEKYDGKFVTVVGFLVMDSEGDGLYLHQEDHIHGIDANSVPLDRTHEMTRNREKLDASYVLITGTYKKDARGLDYPQTGRLTEIVRCEVWSNLAHPRAELFRHLHNGIPQ